MYFKQGDLFFAVIFSTFVIKALTSNDCRKTGMCNYGGKCDRNHACRCVFQCDSLWPTTIYCGIKINGQRNYYINLCQLLAHACELQTDIPLVKFNMKTRKCEDDIPPDSRLCDRPQDYMGPCGGSLGLKGSLGAGVCLRSVQTGIQYCECPADKTGSDCYTKVNNYMVEKSSSDEKTSSDGLKLTKTVTFTAGILLLCSVVLLLILKRVKARSKKDSTSSKLGILTTSPIRNDLDQLVVVEIDSDQKINKTAIKSTSIKNASTKKTIKQTKSKNVNNSLQVVPALTSSNKNINSTTTDHISKTDYNYNMKEDQ